jgi:sugar transferase (PEP-CTERM/EpsH1 system associated)
MGETGQRHVLHLVYRFSTGGLENVVVQLVNGLDHTRFRHTVVALTTIDAAFASRVLRKDVEFIALNKAPGQPFKMYPAMLKLLRKVQPDVFHSCNLAALEFAPIAALAGIPLRIHAEHGWDVADPDGSNRKYQWLRKLYQHFVHQFVVVSKQLQDYLLVKIGVPAARVQLIPNGVDTSKFRPRLEHDDPASGFPFNRKEHFVIGTVGRLERIKNQPLLARSFVALVQAHEGRAAGLRLAIVGAGPLREEVQQILRDADMEDRLWMPGVRGDVAEVLRSLDCFVLPSLSEGTSCTLQEAMACGIPLLATDVGGNRQVLADGALGVLVPSESVPHMKDALEQIWKDRGYASPESSTGPAYIKKHFALDLVLNRYGALFGA